MNKDKGSHTIISGVPEGLDPRIIADLALASAREGGAGLHMHIARDDRRMEQLEAGLQFFAPNLKIISFPAWDTVPYDRVSP